MRRHHAQYALLLVAATTVRVIYEYEGQLRASSLASRLQPPRRLGCAVDDATFHSEAEKVNAGPTCGSIAAIASYWVDAPSTGSSPLFASRIIDATTENHRAVAAASGVRYVRGTSGHPRCGKMRFVSDTLATLAEGEWLLFLDADAAIRCGAWSAFASAACRRSSPQAGYRLAEPLSLIAGSKFGVFLVRNDGWARDYLDRFATALEARPLLCATSTFPENAAAASVTTEADRCADPAS